MKLIGPKTRETGIAVSAVLHGGMQNGLWCGQWHGLRTLIMSLAGTLIFVVGVHSKSMLSVCLLLKW